MRPTQRARLVGVSWHRDISHRPASVVPRTASRARHLDRTACLLPGQLPRDQPTGLGSRGNERSPGIVARGSQYPNLGTEPGIMGCSPSLGRSRRSRKLDGPVAKFRNPLTCNLVLFRAQHQTNLRQACQCRYEALRRCEHEPLVGFNQVRGDNLV